MMQIGGIPSPVGVFGKVLWSSWMVIQTSQLVVVFCSVIMSIAAMRLVFNQVSLCTTQAVFLDWSIANLFATTTSFFLPQARARRPSPPPSHTPNSARQPQLANAW